jgi:hypothetical protein
MSRQVDRREHHVADDAALIGGDEGHQRRRTGAQRVDEVGLGRALESRGEDIAHGADVGGGLGPDVHGRGAGRRPSQRVFLRW